MYDLNCAKTDFPWTRIRNNSVEPWRDIDSGWFDDMLPGWGDVIHEHLIKLDRILKDNNATNCIVISQVKEKFGTLRFYYDICDEEGFSIYSDEKPWISIFDQIVHDMEYATGTVCCFCGTTSHLKSYPGWIHYACDTCERNFHEQSNNTTN